MGRDLTARVQQNAAAQGGEQQPPSIEQSIARMEDQFALAMPRGAEATQLVRDAITALRTTRNLAQCDQASILGGLMTCAQLGLRPGVLGHAWLLPFWDKNGGPHGKGGHKAQLVIGYQGLVELAMRSGHIASLMARTVYENEHFEVDYGLEDRLVHRPVVVGEKGKPIAYYAVVKYTSGGHSFWVMSHSEMEVYRDTHATAKNREGKVVGPWANHFEAMARKTCVRQLAKWMPKSTDLAVALEADESVRVDLRPEQMASALQHPDGYLAGEVLSSDDPRDAEGAAPAQDGTAA